MIKSLCSLFLIVALGGCNGSKRAPLDPSGFENPIGKAVVLRMITDAREAYANAEPVPFTLVLGGGLRAPSAPFLKELADAGHTFVGPSELDYDRVTKATVLKGTRTNPIVIQLSKISQSEPGSREVEAAWNRNRDVVRKTFRITGDPDAGPLTVTELSVLQDERFPEDGA